MSLHSAECVQNQTLPLKRYKESETGLAYTFARVNLGSLNNMPAFVNVATYDGRPVLKNDFKYKNISEKSANEWTYSYLQTLGSPDKKFFVTLDYIHADGTTNSPLPIPAPSYSYQSYVHPFFRGKVLDFVEDITTYSQFKLPYFTCVKNKFDLGNLQSGAFKRLVRAKHADFSIYGGLDVTYFSNFYKISILGFDNVESALSWSKSSKNVSSVVDQSQIPLSADIFNPQGKEGPYTRSFKNHYYGLGPNFGAKLQVPFAYDYLRLNVKLEASFLMGYGSSYFHYDQAFYEPTSNVTYIMTELDTYNCRHQHEVRCVPLIRGEVSLDLIVKNFGLSIGFQEQVYYQLMDINPLVDHQEFMTEFNYSISPEFNHGNGNSSRDRLSKVTYGGPFVKVSYLF